MNEDPDTRREVSAPEDTVFDVTFIGGGPVALYGLFCAGLHGLSAKVIEALSQLGGQLAALYPEKYIYDVGGLPAILALDLVDNLKKQGLQYGPAVCLNERVENLESVNGIYKLTTNRGEHYSRTVILTAGIGAFKPRRLEVPGMDRFEENGVYYAVPRLDDWRGKALLVVGGGDSAVDWALALERVARKVTLIHRRKGFRAMDDSVKRLFASGVEVKLFHELKELRGAARLEEAVIFDNRTGDETVLPVDGVVLALGFTPNLGRIHDWGIEVRDDQIPVNSYCETNLPGVYAAGDIAWYPGKLKLIATGFGEVATAVGAAKVRLDPHARVQVHSSNLKPPLRAGDEPQA